jgi:nitrate reductase NapE component
VGVRKKDLEDIASFVFALLAAMLYGVLFLAAVVSVTVISWRMVMPEVFGLPGLSLKNAAGLGGLGLVVRYLVFSRRSER